MNYDILEYGDGHMYSVFSSRNQSAGRTIKTTLAYHPFEAPFPLTSPPNSTVYVPWVLGCDAPGSVKLGMAAKGKFYYICEVWENRNAGCTRGSRTLLSEPFL